MKTKIYRISKYLFETLVIVISITYIVIYGEMYKDNIFHIAVWDVLNILFWRELYRTLRKSYDDEDDGVITVVVMFINSMVSTIQIVATLIIICMISNWINITIMSAIGILFLMELIKVRISLRLSR